MQIKYNESERRINMTEVEKQKNGQWYLCNDPELKKIRVNCNKLIFQLNQLDNGQKKERFELQKQIFEHIGQGTNVKSSFQCDYGKHIYFGENVFVNDDCVFLDSGRIEIGDNTFIGPQVGIYTVTHPFDVAKRLAGIQRAMPVKIGKNCWICGHVTINPGVTLGNNVVVASGAVVTQSFEDNVLIAGVPAKIIRKLEKGEEIESSNI